MNVIIIGGAGGIGTQLVHDLMGTHNLFVGYRSSSIDVPVESVQLDATNFESVSSLITNAQEKWTVLMPLSVSWKSNFKACPQVHRRRVSLYDKYKLENLICCCRAAGGLLRDVR